MRSHRRYIRLVSIALVLCLSHSLRAQSANRPANSPDRLPYAFTNLVWWSDADLRSELKKRIPGLTDEIAPTNAAESRLRDALTTLLKQKGITADIISEGPSPASLIGVRDPELPAPAIEFSILNPPILVDRIAAAGAPELTADAIRQALKKLSDREYSSRQYWSIRSRIKTQLQQYGYFDAHVDIDHDAPRQDGDKYLVNLVLAIDSGPKYHIGEITVDGGPLLQGRDPSSAFTLKPGDAATSNPWGSLGANLRALYANHGYADVIVNGDPILDREHALVSYHLSVTPGPLYRLRSLTINHLDPDQESKVRRLLALNPGDPFSEAAISNLYTILHTDSSFSGYTFGYRPKRDKAAEAIDLTLDFSQNSEQPRVIVH